MSACKFVIKVPKSMQSNLIYQSSMFRILKTNNKYFDLFVNQMSIKIFCYYGA